MITLKCKSCGDIISIDKNESSVMCPSCGNIYDVPTDEKKEQYLNLYSRADDAWDHKDFEEASELYQQILNGDNTQAEAHFGLVLCKYGITYEIDPITQKKMPTCNRINRDSILDDKHFQSAIKYASKEAAASFQKRAQEIDRISRDFLKIVDKEPPYDVFISYKRTAEDGSITQDSKVARKLYFHLKEKGFKIFFAEETLKSIAGEKYEPYIFAALSSAPVMILVGSKRDHFDATWVKNEWRRYLVLMNQGLKKTLIPAYFEMDPYHMPGELRNLQAMNAADFTFHEDITEIIRKKVADAKDGKTSSEVQGQSLRDKYATKEKVDKLVDVTDCDREFAINVLVQCHGDIRKSQQFIEEDPEYKKSLWICAECNANNTHDKCHSCGTTKKESIEVARARKEMEERERKKSAEYKRKKAATIKKILTPIIVIAAIASLFAFVVWPKLIYPNMANDDFNTPEIVQSYCYSTDKKDVILTITECTADGQVKATWEFIHDGKYGKVNLTGKIVEKKNNGDVVIEWTSNSVEMMPDGITWTDEKTAKISKEWTVVKTDTLTLNAGSNDEYTIDSADDFQKLSGSSGTYHLKSDIDLSGVNWTPIEGFSGMLLGNGYTIKNLKIESSADNVGFFSILNGIVMNLNFENASINVSGRHENVGVLCGKLESGKVSNISVSGEVEADTSSNVAGIVGCVAVPEEYQLADLYNSATVKALNNVGGVAGYIMNSCNRSADQTVTLSRLENTGKIEGKGDCIGGIIGQLMFDNGYGNLILCASDFKNTGSVDGKTNVGGISGYAKADSLNSYMQDCSNAASIVGESYVGCLAGQLKYITVEDCTNAGSTLTATAHTTIDGEKYAYVGGFVGYGYLANNCTNEVEISYSGTGRYVGGIFGYTDASEEQSMTGLKNVANISGYNYVGGIIGGYVNGCNRSADQTVTLSQFENTATIFGKSDYVGGIVGYLSFDNGYGNLILYATEMKNSGNVSGIVYVGGVFGYAKSDALTSYMQDCSSAAAISGEAYVGCIVGQAKYIVVNDCSNAGSTLTATGHVTTDGVKYAFVGGYVGSGYLANNCTNEVEIIYNGTGRYVGGIMGYTDASESYSMEGLENNAKISGYSYVGGIIGGCTNSCNRSAAQTVSLAQFKNTASVSAKSDYVGGIIGYLTQSNGYGELILYISDFQNSGAVSGKSYVGGLLGYAKSDSKNSSISDSSSSVGSIAGKLESITTK